MPDRDADDASELEAGVLLEGRWLVRVVDSPEDANLPDGGVAIVLGAIDGGFAVAGLRLGPADARSSESAR